MKVFHFLKNGTDILKLSWFTPFLFEEKKNLSLWKLALVLVPTSNMS